MKSSSFLSTKTVAAITTLFIAATVSLGATAPAPIQLEGWSTPPIPTSQPKDYVNSTSSGTGQVSAIAYNPDPSGTGIVYSSVADDPNSDVALINLAENLGKDPIRIYEWVRNNIRTEFYYGAHRGAYLTYLERAGNDIDQCALLGALFKAAGYDGASGHSAAPIYRLEYVYVPRTASGPNQVGVYDWAGVSDDASAFSVLSAYSPQSYDADKIALVQMWVSINIPGRGNTRFVPSIKPHLVGRRPSLDALSDYSWNNAALASGSGSTTASSPAISSANLKAHLNGLATTASTAIRADGSLRDLSGAELARLPVVVPEIVSVTAPNATRYPQGLLFTLDENSLALTGIPKSYCGSLRVKVGAVEHWFLAPELMGKQLAVEFDGNGAAILRLGGAEVLRDSVGNSSQSIDLDVTYEFPPAYFSGAAPQTGGKTTTLRQAFVAVSYSFGRTVDRLQKILQDISAKEALSASNITTGDRLQVIGYQYASQLHELAALGVASLDHDLRRHVSAGFVKLSVGSPVLDVKINLAGIYSRSSSAPTTKYVNSAVSLLMGALEGTAIEQLSGNRSFGTASLFDQAMTLSYGATYVTSAAQLNSAGIQNYSDTYLGSGATADIQAHLNSGGHVVLLNNSNITYNGLSFGGYFKVFPTDGGVSSLNKGALGGTSTGGLGIVSFLTNLWNGVKKAVKTIFTQPPATSNDPVDLNTGAFYKEDTDLVVGAGDGPNGLRLDRQYNSARRFVDPTGLGRGWIHNYHMKLDFGNRADLDSLRAGADEVLPLLIAMRHAQDSLQFEPTAARSWLLACTSLTWAVDQQINTQVNIAMGATTLEFIKRPDSSYVPASNMAAALVKQTDGSHDLTFRNSNTIHFQASDGKFTSIKDPFNNTLTATYVSGRLSVVTDSYNRTLTFSYDGAGRLYQVADSTGRSVQYGLEGTTFTFTDAEGKTQRYEMGDPDAATDSTRSNLLTRVRDARNRIVVENDYDFWKQVWRQRTFGDTARTTYININPGIGTEIDPTGNAVRTYFDARGRKIFVVDQASKLAAWQYDGIDRLVKVITPKGFTATFGYDANHVLTSEQNPVGHTRTITPDTRGRPVSISNFEGQITTVEYWNTTSELVKTVSAPGGIVSSFTYDARGRVSTRHPASYATNQNDTYAYDGFGNLDKITHPDAAFDDFTFSARGDLLEMIDRKSVKTSYTYNNRSQPTGVTQYEGTTARTITTVYDDAGDVSSVIDASGRKADTEHDALGHLASVKRGPLNAQGAPSVTVLTNHYDVRNLLDSATDALSNVTSYGYTSTQHVNSVTDPLNRTTAMGYDEDQRPYTTTTPLGYLNTVTLDSRGFKDAVTDAENQMVDYVYDKDGRMTTLANRLNNPFTWSYDDANRKVTSKTPRQQPNKPEANNATVAVANTRGLPDTITEPSGQVTTFNTYDAEGRLLTKTDGVGTTTYVYWPNGLLKNVTENGHTTYREYDTLNRLTRYDDGEGRTLTYTYYPSGELNTIAYPGNKTVTYDYDDFGRLFHVTDWANRVTTYNYDNASRLTKITRPNGTYRTQDYDAASQLRFVKECNSSGGILAFEELKYDSDGRITSQFVHPLPAAVTLPGDNLTYDADNRLSTFNAATVIFDADGNMTTGPQPSGAISLDNYGYDSRNRLTRADTAAYRYNPDGLRVEITGAGAATFVIDPNAAFSRTLMRTQGGVTTYYVYGLGLLYEDTGGATKTYHFDHLGSTLALTDGSQVVTDKWTYAPFGAIASRTGTTDTPFQFNGELGVQTDANGLLHMRARYYNPRLMRFLNADPIRFDGGLNWYAYVANDPVENVDPNGTALFPVHFAVTLIAELGQGHILTGPIVAFQSAWTDFRMVDVGGGKFQMSTTSNNALATNIHAMGGFDSTLGRAQTREEAYVGSNKILSQNLAAANDSTKSFWYRLTHLADAYHGVEDHQVPPHANYPDFSNGFGGFANGISHVIGDIIMSPVNFLKMLSEAFKVRSGNVSLSPPSSQTTLISGRK